MFEMFDKMELLGKRRTQDGFLVANVRAGRTGIQLYRGSEVGMHDKEVVRVYRPADEVFDKDAMATLAHRPVTNDHPPELVTSDNWRDYAIGSTGGQVARDGEFLVVPMSVMDAGAAAQIEAGKEELSLGYTCDLDFTAGVTKDGDEYDAVQRNIRINHLAVVKVGRAGAKCRIGDNNPKTEIQMLKVLIDGITIETTEQGAEAIKKLQTQLDQATAKLDAQTTSHDEAIAAKDKELGVKDAEIQKLKDAAPDADALTEMARKHSEVVDAATKIAPNADFKGMDAATIRRTAVSDKVGEDKIKDKSDDYVEAMFDSFVETAKKSDQFRAAMTTQRPQKTTDGSGAPVTREDAYSEMLDGMQNAWKGKD